jgi:hypothetical protein
MSVYLEHAPSRELYSLVACPWVSPARLAALWTS